MQRYCEVADTWCPRDRIPPNAALEAEEEDAGNYEGGVAPQERTSRSDGNLPTAASPGDDPSIDRPVAHVDGVPRTDSKSRSLGCSETREACTRTKGTGRRGGGSCEALDNVLLDVSPDGKRVGVGGGLWFGVGGFAAAAFAVLASAFALASRDGATDGLEGRGDELGGGGWRWPWRLALAYAGRAGALLMVESVVVVVAITCLWCAVRLARWREEIFAGSPIVSEALSRAAGLDSGGQFPAGGGAEGNTGRTGGTRDRVSGEEAFDPVGDIFGPHTRAGRDFFCDPAAEAAGASTGGHRAAGAEPAAAVDEGAVVFLTGVTGLVGQMVLFDLLRQGAAVSRAAGGEEAKRRATERGADGRGRGEGLAWRGGLRRVVVLVRGKKGMRASDRLSSIRNSPMFRPMRESGAWVDASEAEEVAADVATTSSGGSPSRVTPDAPEASPLSLASEGVGLPNKTARGATVTVVEGELGKEGLGLSAESRALLAEAGVTHALHCAASVSFSDPVAEAAATNVTGALRVAALVASWPSCR